MEQLICKDLSNPLIQCKEYAAATAQDIQMQTKLKVIMANKIEG
jgi:hypothetical protein